MTSLCLTAGTRLEDILWAATVLPALREALPKGSLTWECPVPEFQAFMSCFSELNGVVGDVEEMIPAPDDYIMLHPFWRPPEPGIDTPLDAVFAQAGAWCRRPDTLPVRPYVPQIQSEKPHTPGIPGNFVCMDPGPGQDLTLSEEGQKLWVALAAYLSLVPVQVGSSATPLLKGVVDARGVSPEETARIMASAILHIGTDSDSSCLASALKVPQVWVYFSSSHWWWPRGAPPECVVLAMESPETLKVQAVLTAAWEKMVSQG